MAQLLDYLPVNPRLRRRHWVMAAIVVVVIVASAVLAVPQVKAFQERQNRRAAIRQQFGTQLASAEQWLDSKDIDAAALSILQAEFPRHTESKLFWRSELASFDRRVTLTRRQMCKLSAQQNAEREIKRKSEETQREIKAKEGEEVTSQIRCYSLLSRAEMLDPLVRRGAEFLKSGDNSQAFVCCVQIVMLDPLHQFDESFWANVPK